MIRNPGELPGEYSLTSSYDRLGGYLAAKALVLNSRGDKSWFACEGFLEHIFGVNESRHWLAEDILISLVTIFPETFGIQLWQAVPVEYKSKILTLSPRIDSSVFDDATLKEYRRFVFERDNWNRTFRDLTRVASSGHQLNAEFMSSVLEALPMAERDLHWSEYTRQTEDDLNSLVSTRAQLWAKKGRLFRNSDRLIALNIMWMLTSTSHRLRDLSSKALYEYGKGASTDLFEMALYSLNIDDPYVSERMLAISYGVSAYHHNNHSVPDELLSFAMDIYNRVFSSDATAATSHCVSRTFASRIVQLANINFPGELAAEALVGSVAPYPNQPEINYERVDYTEARLIGPGSPFRRNFENYAIGRLVSGRRNYDYEHADYKKVKSEILWRAKSLGWSKSAFGDIDSRISQYSSRRFGGESNKVDRYGKKYSWIAYNESAGKLISEGGLDRREDRFNNDCDPNFPRVTPESKQLKTLILTDSNEPNDQWLEARIDVHTINSCPELDYDCEWMLLDGAHFEKNKAVGREGWFRSRVFLLEADALNTLHELIEEYVVSDFMVPDIAFADYPFIGDLHWLDVEDQADPQLIQVQVGSKTKEIEGFRYKGSSSKDGASTLDYEAVPQLYEEAIYKDVEVLGLALSFEAELERSYFPNISARCLSDLVFKELGLKFDLENIQYFDTEGELAACNVKVEGNWDDNQSNGFYLRKDLMDNYIEKKGLRAVRFVEGEKGILDDEVMPTYFSFFIS